MLTDAGALGLTLLSAWIALRPANQSKTYGYQRWEILAALVNGAALFGIAGWVVVEAVQRIQQPQPIRAGLFLVVAAAGLVVNLVSLCILHGIRDGNLNTRGAYLHVLGDALGSVGALAAAAIIATTGWTLADPIISIALSLLILVGAWRLLRESTDILLESVPGHVSMAGRAAAACSAVPGVTAVHDLHVWARDQRDGGHERPRHRAGPGASSRRCWSGSGPRCAGWASGTSPSSSRSSTSARSRGWSRVRGIHITAIGTRCTLRQARGSQLSPGIGRSPA